MGWIEAQLVLTVKGRKLIPKEVIIDPFDRFFAFAG